MEESGHYYTVYFVALAVGFEPRTAQQAAFYTQMADEIEELDAVNRELNQANEVASVATFGGGVGALMGMLLAGAIISTVGVPALFGTAILGIMGMIAGAVVGGVSGVETGIKIKEKLDSTTMRENQWRLCVEYGLHALTGRDAEQERKKTTDLLRSTLPTQDVRFGLLLHRLGDTYAHTDPSGKILHKSSESMASFMRGHLFEGTHADHGWERQELFFKYLENLYIVLDERVKKIRMPRNKTLKLDNLKSVFKDILYITEVSSQSVTDKMGYIDRFLYEDFRIATGLLESQIEPEQEAQRIFARVIKAKAKTHLEINMDAYSPENNKLITLEEFLRKYKIKDQAGKIITVQDIKDIVTQVANDANKE